MIDLLFLLLVLLLALLDGPHEQGSWFFNRPGLREMDWQMRRLSERGQQLMEEGRREEAEVQFSAARRIEQLRPAGNQAPIVKKILGL